MKSNIKYEKGKKKKRAQDPRPTQSKETIEKIIYINLSRHVKRKTTKQ